MSSVLGQYKSPFHNLPDPVWSGPRHIPKAPLLLRSLPHPLSCSCTNLIVSQIAQTHSRLAAFAPAAHSSPRYPYGQCPHPLNLVLKCHLFSKTNPGHYSKLQSPSMTLNSCPSICCMVLGKFVTSWSSSLVIRRVGIICPALCGYWVRRIIRVLCRTQKKGHVIVSLQYYWVVIRSWVTKD